jgi:GTPase involved in cell partitioning and DNA repair
MFLDEARIRVKAGDGGNGCMAFRREKFVPRGGPSGGDGGRGGDVIMESSNRHNTLILFRYNPEHKGERGRHGEGSNCTGRDGEGVVLRVPVGTLLYDEADGKLIHDFATPDERIVIAKGGRGGRGNQHFATPTHQAPREHELGRAGEERNYRLELKLLADAGLVGFPNVGKSTLIARISAARPKIADYPFTTLEPNLGVVRVGPQGRGANKRVAGSEGKGKSDVKTRSKTKTATVSAGRSVASLKTKSQAGAAKKVVAKSVRVSTKAVSAKTVSAKAASARTSAGSDGGAASAEAWEMESFVVADIPGLIEGAHLGAGLGVQFLRHIERTRVLVHLVDVSDGSGREDPVEDFHVIMNELKSFGHGLAEKPMIVAAAKCDVANPDKLKKLRTFAKKKKLDFYEISAVTGAGVDALVYAMAAKIRAGAEAA